MLSGQAITNYHVGETQFAVWFSGSEIILGRQLLQPLARRP